MSPSIEKKHSVQLGVVPTHLKFVGGLVPDENGKLPRDESGSLVVVANLNRLMSSSAAPIDCVQIPYFPGLDEEDVEEMVNGFRAAGLEVHFILMVGGADPMNPVDEDKVVEILKGGVEAAARHGVQHVSSTSVEEWMQAGATRREGSEFEQAVEQNAKLHARVVDESVGADSPVQAWHIEFLRGGEFQTFTDLGRIWQFVKAVNAKLGRPFFKVLVDAAHCGDSSLDIPANIALIREIAEADALGIFHASAKTTRGCLSTDDGWIGALLTACAETGKLETAFVEVFHHEDAALEALRNLDPGHGLDTRDGRDYDQVVLDGLAEVSHRLNNLKVRGKLA